MNALDIILIGIIVVSGVVGYFKGLIRTVFGLVGLIATIILTVMLTPVVSNYIIESTQFDEMISAKTIELLDIEKIGKLNQIEGVEKIEGLSLPTNIIRALKESYTPTFLKEFNIASMGDYIGRGIAHMAVKALVFFILFIVISMLINAVVTLLDLVSRLPVLKEANNFGGLLVGVVIGVGIVWVGTLLLSFALSIQATSGLSSLIENSILTKLFYYNNPLQNFIMHFKSGS